MTLTSDELQSILTITLLNTAVQKLESNHAKVRSLYRSQLFFEAEYNNSDLRIADGNDSELVYAIGEELKELKNVLKKVIKQIEAQS